MFKKFAIASVAIGLIVIGGVGTNYFIQADKANQTAIATRKSEQAILDEFYALSSKLDVGLTYVQYGEELAQLKALLDKFEREQEKSVVIPSFRLAMSNYVDALSFWKQCNDYCTKSKTLLIDYVKGERLTSDESSNLNNDPDIQERLKLINVYGINTEFDSDYNRKAANESEALSKIWSQAKVNINNAQNLIKPKN